MTDRTSVTFTVQALAEPGLLPRLLQPFAKRDIIPDRVAAERQGEGMRVAITLHAPDPGVLHLLAGNLGQVVGVLEVRQEVARWAQAA